MNHAWPGEQFVIADSNTTIIFLCRNTRDLSENNNLNSDLKNILRLKSVTENQASVNKQTLKIIQFEKAVECQA